MVNVPNSLNNLKTKTDNSDVDKLRSVPVDDVLDDISRFRCWCSR